MTSDGVLLHCRERRRTSGVFAAAEKKENNNNNNKNDDDETITTTTALVFLHGSYHASWCYEEFFFEYFCGKKKALGVDAFAMDFRGQGESGLPTTLEDEKVAGTMERHAMDVREYVARIRERKTYEKVYVVGHSFGGLIAQKAFAEDVDEDGGGDGNIDGMILLASVPPTGNGEMVKRFLKTDLWKSLKITYAFIAKQFGTDSKSCRECFFSKEVGEEDVKKYMRLINDSSKARLLDLRKLNEELPIADKSGGKKKGKEKVLVIGGRDDYVVDATGVRETAEFWQTEAILIDGLAHDVMLDTKWQTVAERMMQFISHSSSSQ